MLYKIVTYKCTFSVMGFSGSYKLVRIILRNFMSLENWLTDEPTSRCQL